MRSEIQTVALKSHCFLRKIFQVYDEVIFQKFFEIGDRREIGL